MSDEVDQRIAVVTGASSGLGVAMAQALGELGWKVAVGARRVDRLAETAKLVEAAGGEATYAPLDVADPASVDAFFDEIESTFGPADVVVSNAGLSIPGHAWEIDPGDLAHEVAVNLLGPMYVARRALPAMIEKRSGDVVFVTSDAAIHARPQQSTYTATKKGLEGYAKALSMELEGTGVRSTVVRPGPAVSEYAASWNPEKIVDLIAYWPHFGLQRHLGTMPSEAVARAVKLAVTTPKGVVLDTIEVQPEAPLAGEPSA